MNGADGDDGVYGHGVMPTVVMAMLMVMVMIAMAMMVIK